MPIPQPMDRTQTVHTSPSPAAGAAPAPTPDLHPPAHAAGQLDPMVGQHLGEYVVRRYIGSGGMGVVYEGEHVTIGRKVAIKFIREEQTKSPHARGLLTEARAASAIRHHGIIDIFGFGQQAGVGQYLVMEYLEGLPLNEVLQALAPLPISESFALLCEVLDALSAAHAVGVIHRDLKPSNIFVVRQSNGAEYIKVLDFGLAKRSTTPEGTTPQTYSDVIVGTPQYMAPEQALCEKVGPQTDLYAVGVIAFEMVTGQRPFPGRSHMEIVAHHLKTPPPVPSSIAAVPPEVDELILRLLAKEPQQRPASASEVARTLRAMLQPQETTHLPMARLSRSIPVIKPPSGEAPAQAPTATLQPSPASPTPKAEVLPPSAVRSGRGKWAMAAGGAALLVLGVALIWGRPATPQEPSPPRVASPEPVQQAEAVAAALPTSEPAPSTLVSPAPSPAPPAVTARREAPTPASTKKKPAAPKQPVSATAEPIQPPSPPPEVIVERAATGKLHVIVQGAWADVWVDQQRLGRVPPTHSYTLATGEHSLELRNPAFPPYRRTIVVPPGGTLQHTADFSSSAQVSSP